MATPNIIASLFTRTKFTLLNTGILLLRWTIGIVLFMTGAGKVFGWFGGLGMTTTMGFYAQMGLGGLLAYLSIYTEFIGGLLLVLGLFTRPVSIAVTINMLVATIVMWPKGFIIGGAAFPFTFLVSSIIILLTGPMAYSLDAVLFGWGRKPETTQEPDGTAASTQKKA